MATTKFSTIIGSAQVVPVISPTPVAYTFPVPTNLGAGSGTNAAFGIQNVSKLQATLVFTKDVTSGTGTGNVTFTMPAGLTLATSVLSGNKIGSATLYVNTNGVASDVVALTSTTFAINKGAATAGTRLQGADFTGGTQIIITLDCPIVEYIANSYVAQGAGLATSVKPGLVTNSIPPTNLVSTDLTSQTNCTIDPGDVLACKFAMTNGKVDFYFNLATVTVGTAVGIQFTLPTSVPRPLTTFYTTYTYYDNSGSNLQIGMMSVDTSGTVALFKAAGAAWTASTNGTYLRGEIFWFTI